MQRDGDGLVVSLLGDNVSRENEQWWYVHAPGIDEPILMVRRQRIDSFTLARLQGVSDGLGHLLSVADKDGDINSAYASPGDGQSVWGSAGFTSREQTSGPNRWASPTLGSIATFRNRQYDPETGRWLQEDPIGLAGGVNLYQYTGNNPASFGDPFGLCKDDQERDRPCKVEISPEGRFFHAKMEGLTSTTRERLQALADSADVDIGINSTTQGNHSDPGHRAGTAVDIGWINGKDIGTGETINPGMLALASKVQGTAARIGGLNVIGNLGPAGKYLGPRGPLPINNPLLLRRHLTHIHLSFGPDQ